ncbi:MAG TPA: thermonuclease family protein [Dissulfurispiraceae bacterium]|nr:thermonuclease family protein [Dissulfurispiraceae bacterium]
MKRYYYTKVAAIIFLIFLIVFITSPLYALPGTPYLVTAVNDGDTVSIKVRSFAGFPTNIERVRLIGIDAPELSQEPWGRRAKKHLKELLSKSDWVVNVEFDAEQRDQYGRLLGYLWNRRSQTLINEQMLEDGYAVLYTVPPNVKYAERFIEAQQRAYSKRLGVWSRSGLTQSPGQWRKDHPSYR